MPAVDAMSVKPEICAALLANLLR